MEIIKNKNSKFIAELLSQGKMFILPTDTSYCVAGKISQKVISKIFKIKKRHKEKAIPVFVNKELVKKIAVLDNRAKELIKNFWPGALTIVLKVKSSKITSLKPILGPKNTIAVREPDNKLILNILKNLKKPITATSANISAKLPAYKPEEVLKYFSKTPAPDYFIDFGQLPKNPVSTIIDITDKVKILRRGKIKLGDIKKCLRNK